MRIRQELALGNRRHAGARSRRPPAHRSPRERRPRGLPRAGAHPAAARRARALVSRGARDRHGRQRLHDAYARRGGNRPVSPGADEEVLRGEARGLRDLVRRAPRSRPAGSGGRERVLFDGGPRAAPFVARQRRLEAARAGVAPAVAWRVPGGAALRDPDRRRHERSPRGHLDGALRSPRSDRAARRARTARSSGAGTKLSAPRSSHAVRSRTAAARQRRGAPDVEIEAAWQLLDPSALTISFARRFATYKRATLIFHDRDRLARLVETRTAPCSFSSRARRIPRTSPARSSSGRSASSPRPPEFRGRVVLLDDYDMRLARLLVSGSDVWLNNPIRPNEASGTSGMKAAMNGVLNLSVLDGWWDEAPRDGAGFTMGDDTDGRTDDDVAAALYERLEDEVIPLFYDRPDGDRARMPAGVGRENGRRRLATRTPFLGGPDARRLPRDVLRARRRARAQTLGRRRARRPRAGGLEGEGTPLVGGRGLRVGDDRPAGSRARDTRADVSRGGPAAARRFRTRGPRRRLVRGRDGPERGRRRGLCDASRIRRAPRRHGDVRRRRSRGPRTTGGAIRCACGRDTRSCRTRTRPVSCSGPNSASGREPQVFATASWNERFSRKNVRSTFFTRRPGRAGTVTGAKFRRRRHARRRRALARAASAPSAGRRGRRSRRGAPPRTLRASETSRIGHPGPRMPADLAAVDVEEGGDAEALRVEVAGVGERLAEVSGARR